MTLDHAAAHERIADLALEPARLAGLAMSPDPLDQALLDHADRCADCRAELEAWRRTQTILGDALTGDIDVAPDLAPIHAPDRLRDALIRGVRAEPRPVVAAGRRRPLAPRLAERAWRSRAAVLGLAAALVVVVLGVGSLQQQASRVDELVAQTRGLSAVAAAVDRVLGDPEHRVAELRAPDGVRGGTIAWSRHDLVVVTTTLAEPGDDQLYRCWLNEDGTGWAVGQMYFANGTGYWVGTLDEWAAFEIGSGTRFRVSLEPRDADPQRRSGPIVLEADLGAALTSDAGGAAVEGS